MSVTLFYLFALFVLFTADSLKKGGKFYLCWVADSWPMRFGTITHRQLWSQDIRKICADLIEVLQSESGRPTNRFSLRLSSQLMRGVVRLYEKKVNVCLSDMCMLNASVLRHINRLYTHPEVELPAKTPEQQVLHQPQIPPPTRAEEEEQPVEEIIQRSGNLVANVQDITLKEAAIPEFRIPPSDGFGEEHPDQALQLLGDRTLEMMMVPTDLSAAQHSGLELGLDVSTDKSHDRSRLVAQSRQMERISEHDVTLFRRSHGRQQPVADIEREVPEVPVVPIPEIPIPEMPIPQEKLAKPAAEIPEQVVEPPKEAVPIPEVPIEAPTAGQSEQIELEELDETESRPKRRRLHRKLIVDKKTKLNTNFLRSRIANPNVELRCQDSSDDIVDIIVPFELLTRRPCRAGHGVRHNASLTLTRMFQRNLGVVPSTARTERELEQAAPRRSMRSHITLPHIPEEEPRAAQAPTIPALEIPQPMELDQRASVLDTNVQPTVEAVEDFMQKIDTPSVKAKKRLTVDEPVISPKRSRPVGYVSFRESQQRQAPVETALPAIVEPAQPEIPALDQTEDKENVPANTQRVVRGSQDSVQTVMAILQDAGLADRSIRQPLETSQPLVAPHSKKSKSRGSEASETPLGSLDRTKVSLGDSDTTTDSRRMIRENWGTTGTMILIWRCIHENLRPITVKTLLEKGPVTPGYTHIIAARCFSSILELKQSRLINIEKCPETNEILNITRGPKFDFI